MAFFSFFRKPKTHSKQDELLLEYLQKLFGRSIRNLEYYKVAFTHQSHSDKKGLNYNNERLEFLGDAVLDMAVSEYLYQQYPEKNEGQLTRMRSSVVNRKCLNDLANKIDLIPHIRSEVNLNQPGISLPGNALEALIGAIYIDLGYNPAKAFVLQGLVQKYLDLEELEKQYENFKSTLLEWSQQEGSKVHFLVSKKDQPNSTEEHNGGFTAKVFINDQEQGKGEGRSKKIAEQKAALLALQQLGLK